MNIIIMAELTSTKLNAESHLLLVRYFLAPLWCLASKNQNLFRQANPLFLTTEKSEH